MPVSATFEISRERTRVQFDQPIGPIGPFVAMTFVTRVSPNDRNTTAVVLELPDTVMIDTVTAGLFSDSPVVNYDGSLSTIVGLSGTPAASFEDFPCSIIA